MASGDSIVPIRVKSVLTMQPSSSPLPGQFTLNPYRGCMFGCRYCYASKFVFDDSVKKAEWGHWVEVKENAVDALRRESRKLQGASIFIGSATDPYQPIERRVRMTRALLEVVLFSFPESVHIQTRSPHVVDDVDLLRRFGDTLTVGMSIPTDSEVVRRAFEPRAPAIGRRLAAARTLTDAGIRVSGSIAPLLPCTPRRLAGMLRGNVASAWVGGLNFYDREEALRSIYAEHGWERYLLPDHKEAVRQALLSIFPAA